MAWSRSTPQMESGVRRDPGDRQRVPRRVPNTRVTLGTKPSFEPNRRNRPPRIQMPGIPATSSSRIRPTTGWRCRWWCPLMKRHRIPLRWKAAHWADNSPRTSRRAEGDTVRKTAAANGDRPHGHRGQTIGWESQTCRCHPISRSGSAAPIRIASSVPDWPSIRLAPVRTPSRCARQMATLAWALEPKSSAMKTICRDPLTLGHRPGRHRGWRDFLCPRCGRTSIKAPESWQHPPRNG